MCICICLWPIFVPCVFQLHTLCDIVCVWSRILVLAARRDDEALDSLKAVTTRAGQRHHYSGQLKGLLLDAFDLCIGVYVYVHCPRMLRASNR